MLRLLCIDRLRSFAVRVACAALTVPALGRPADAALRVATPDEVHLAAVVIEGESTAECASRLSDVTDKAASLSGATSHPKDLVPGLRAFHDITLRLDGRGEAEYLGQLSSVYTTGYDPDGQPRHDIVTTFVRIEVARPPGTPANAPSRVSGAWVWLERMAESRDSETGKIIQYPQIHRFDFVGEMLPIYGTWGHAGASCRVGRDGAWYGAVFVWTYKPY